MIRNVTYLLAGNLATWAVSLAFLLVVPRIAGPVSWGEYSLGFAVAGLVLTVGALGIPTYLVKAISRDSKDSGEYVDASLATTLVLSILILAVVVLFTFVAHYSPHTRAVILLATGAGICAFVVAPAVSALQALEKMHLNAVVNVLRQVISNVAVVLVALIFRPDIIVLILILLAVNLMASLVQLRVTHRDFAMRLRFDRALSLRLISGGLPFWTSGILLTIYAWIDSVLLSLLAPTREVGYYTASVRSVAAIAFLPGIVATVIFPRLARNFHADFEQMRRLTRVSLGGLVTLGLPISVGAVLVGPRAVETVFGPAYGPSGPVMVVLALTIVPAYVATLAYWVLAAADGQRSWAYVMGVATVVNPVINLIAIPYFQSRSGHGSMGAAIALLITDTAVFVAGIALMPRECLRPVGPLLAQAARASLATAAMALPVWFLRESFLPLQVLVGIAVFAVAALALGVLRGEGYDEAWVAITAHLRGRLTRRSGVEVAVRGSSASEAGSP
jgi:O-antigen/teichoic acid export membrane protein